MTGHKVQKCITCIFTLLVYVVSIGAVTELQVELAFNQYEMVSGDARPPPSLRCLRLRLALELGGKTVEGICRRTEKGRGEVWVKKADISRAPSQEGRTTGKNKGQETKETMWPGTSGTPT